jgi:hypothetical protein
VYLGADPDARAADGAFGHVRLVEFDARARRGGRGRRGEVEDGDVRAMLEQELGRREPETGRAGGMSVHDICCMCGATHPPETRKVCPAICMWGRREVGSRCAGGPVQQHTRTATRVRLPTFAWNQLILTIMLRSALRSSVRTGSESCTIAGD